MNLDNQLRHLARSSYWQQLYTASKDCHGIQLFRNTSNFSGIQVLFLYWLRVYSMLYDELYQLEWPNLSEEVIKDDDRCDAFLYWRRKEQEKKLREYQMNQRKGSKGKSGQIFKIFSGPINKSKGDK